MGGTPKGADSYAVWVNQRETAENVKFYLDFCTNFLQNWFVEMNLCFK